MKREQKFCDRFVLKICLLAAFCILTVMPLNAVTLDGTVSSGTADGVSSINVTHTTGTGADRLMLVGVSSNSYNSARTITSVVFSPDVGSDLDFTEVGTVENEAGRLAAIYSLVGPPSGQSGTVTVTFSGNVNYGIVVGVANFAGVEPAYPHGNFVSAVGTQSSALSLDVPTNVGDLVFDTVFLGAATPPSLSVGAGQSQLWNLTRDRMRGVASTEPATSGTTSMSWTPSGGSSSYYWAIGAVAIKQTGTTPPMPEYNIVLARPTANSITINAIAYRDGEMSFEYGTTSGAYGTQTGAVSCTSGEPENVVISSLNADTQYYYRMRHRQAGATEWLNGDEYSFRTRRNQGETFTFTITSDSHLGQTFSGNTPERYEQTTLNVAADNPDFHLDLGDAFIMNEADNQSEADAVYEAQRPYFGNFSHSAPVFLAIGNHENEEGWNFDDTPFSKALGSIKARKKYFPNPVTDSFYSGNDDKLAAIGGDQLREDYFAWTWGDALFVVLDPFQYTMAKPYGTVAGSGEDDDETVSGDQWNWTLGLQQYNWFKEILENSEANFKFVFSHHVCGGQLTTGGTAGPPEYVRGGGMAVPYFEWGGNNANETWGFDEKRDTWGDVLPIHQLMLENGVAAYFHGHDHQFVHEERDGMVYQLVPSPSMTGSGFDLYTGSPYVVSGGNLPNSGHLRVTVTTDVATVEYVRSETGGGGINGDVSHSYTIAAIPPIAVELASLNAGLADNGAVAIEWKTKSEVKTAGFYVQYSDSKAGGFARIHDQLIKARGSSAAGASYRFVDVNNSNKNGYYRLEEVTLDGTSSFSTPVAVSLVSAAEQESQMPLTFALLQNYPNPFNPGTKIEYSLAESDAVTLNIYDLNGRLVRRLVNGRQERGHYIALWDGTNDHGRRVVSGTYIYRLQSGDKTAVRKMAILK